jgi:hypothetical protein
MRSNHYRLAVLAGVVACSSAAFAADIWAVDNLGTTNAATIGDRIIRFNSSNPAGTVVTVGATGVATTLMGGLDFDGAGNLYSASQIANGGSLYSINQSNGMATSIGLLGLSGGYGINDLSWSPQWGMLGLGSAGTTAPHRLYSINLGTGLATSLGDITGMSGALAVGLATDLAGNNYVHDLVTDFMYRVVGLAAVQMSSPIGVATNFSQGMTIDWSNGNGWYLGAIHGAFPYVSDLRSMNLATGGTSAVLGTWPNNGASGLPQYETGDLAIRPVPEPATLAALGLGMAALLRRRKKAA